MLSRLILLFLALAMLPNFVDSVSFLGFSFGGEKEHNTFKELADAYFDRRQPKCGYLVNMFNAGKRVSSRFEKMFYDTCDLKVMSGNQKSVLHLAAYYNHTNWVSLLTQIIDVNLPIKSSGVTALHIAAYKNNGEIVKLLLNNGANVNIVDDLIGSTPLIFALGSEAVESVEVLLNNGADPNVKSDRFGLTPLHIAVLSKNIVNIELLLQHGANQNAEDDYGLTPLFYASVQDKYMHIIVSELFDKYK